MNLTVSQRGSMGVSTALLATLLSALTLFCQASSAPPPTGETDVVEGGSELVRRSGGTGGPRATGFRDGPVKSSPIHRPYFDDISPRNVTAVVGQSAILHCRVKHVGDRTVSWMRKRDLHILTSNIFTYTGDARFSVVHPDPSDDWNLRIEYVQKRDSGIYECQVNTEPKINMAIQLNVDETNPVPIGTTALTGPAPQAVCREIECGGEMSAVTDRTGTGGFTAAQASIWGPEDVYVKKGSTISLTCSVNVHSSPPGSVLWYHGANVVDFDSPRGGISLETEKTASGTTSKLLVTKASVSDSGNYTCVPSNANPASVYVHVLNAGEYPAAMQHGEHGACPTLAPTTLLILLTALALGR